jgi:NAD(P)-dependent dehydrogenase (short-subunit alcohol dehydrogenase family)
MTPSDGCVWITGASTGIGRALALRLAQAGWTVAASARQAGLLADLAAEPSAAGHIQFWPLDVTDIAAMRRTATAIEARLGPIAIAILNAGSHSARPATAFDADDVRTLLEVNFTGAVNGIDAVLPAMLRRRAGQIVLTASVAGYRGLPTAAAYGASKAALINLAESLKLELDRQGVRIRLVNPGFIKTPLTDKNHFPMPFLMPLDRAVERLYRGLQGNAFEITFPRRFTWIMKTLRCLPYPLYFALTRKATGA